MPTQGTPSLRSAIDGTPQIVTTAAAVLINNNVGGRVTSSNCGKGVNVRQGSGGLATKDHILVVSALAGNQTVTLPSAKATPVPNPMVRTAAFGEYPTYIVKRSDGAIGNTVTVFAAGSETIDGQSSVTLAGYGVLQIFSDGTNWLQI